MINYKAVPVPDGAVCIDVYEPLTPGQLRVLRAATWTTALGSRCPIVAIGRTLETLHTPECESIVEAGFGLYTYGEARNDSMTNPSALFGHRDATIHLGLLDRLGLAPHTHALDVEQRDGAHPFPSRGGVIDYVNTWYITMSARTHVGQSPPYALYNGWGLPLSIDLFSDFAVRSYWASSPFSRPVPIRGYQMVQVKESTTIAGVTVDVDVHHTDALGGSWVMSVLA